MLELFAGSGNFTHVLANAGFKAIYALDVVAEALDTLTKQALPGVSTQAADLFKEGVISQLIKRLKPEVILLDPPRDGLKPPLKYRRKIPAYKRCYTFPVTSPPSCAMLRYSVNKGLT